MWEIEVDLIIQLPGLFGQLICFATSLKLNIVIADLALIQPNSKIGGDLFGVKI